MKKSLENRLTKIEASHRVNACRSLCLIFGPNGDAALHFDGRVVELHRHKDESAADFENRARCEARGKSRGAKLHVLSNDEYLAIAAQIEETF